MPFLYKNERRDQKSNLFFHTSPPYKPQKSINLQQTTSFTAYPHEKNTIGNRFRLLHAGGTG